MSLFLKPRAFQLALFGDTNKTVPQHVVAIPPEVDPPDFENQALAVLEGNLAFENEDIIEALYLLLPAPKAVEFIEAHATEIDNVLRAKLAKLGHSHGDVEKCTPTDLATERVRQATLAKYVAVAAHVPQGGAKDTARGQEQDARAFTTACQQMHGHSDAYIQETALLGLCLPPISEETRQHVLDLGTGMAKGTHKCSCSSCLGGVCECLLESVFKTAAYPLKSEAAIKLANGESGG
jgi:hypothetical protein